MAPPYAERQPPAYEGLSLPSHSRPTRSHSRSREPPRNPEPPRAPRRDSRSRSSFQDSSRHYSSRGYSSRPPVSSNTSVKRRWPPAPAVEDEKASLAREANGPKIADSERCEARFRGSVDQIPVLLEVEPPQPARASQQKGRGYNRTDLPNDGDGEQRGAANIKRRGRPELEEENLELPKTPLFNRREASPYTFTPKAPDLSSTITADSGYHSSELNSEAGVATAGKKKPAGFFDEDVRSDALRGNGKSRGGNESDAVSAASGNSVVEYDSESTVSARGDRRPAPYSYSRSGNVEKEGASVTRDSAQSEQQTRLAKLRAEAMEANRRNSDSAATAPRPQFDDGSRLQSAAGLSRRGPPPPIGIAGSWQQMPEVPSRGSSRQSSTSRPSSPTLPPSPSRDPRVTANSYRNEPPLSARSSTSASATGSRPSSPVPNFVAQSYGALRSEEGIRRSSTFPVAMEDNAQRTSRLADSNTRIDDAGVSTGRQTSSLPYPVDDLQIMPSEEYHRYNPRPLGEAFVPRPAAMSSRPPTRDSVLDSPVTSRPVSLEIPPVRSNMTPRYSVESGLPALATAVSGLASQTSKVPETPMTPRTSAGGSDKPRTRCLKVQSNRDCDSWYRLVDCPEFEMCPSCFNSHIASGSFRKYFKQVQRKEANPNVVCSFRTPWYMMAWQLTQEQQRFDLDLFYALARASKESPPCPGKNRESRAWHAVLDTHGDPVHEFDICPCDVSKVEALMPTLRGVFQESHKSGRKRRCNLRVESTRCPEYLERLTEIEAEAYKKRKRPDMGTFVELAREKALTRECARDDMMVDRTWHFATQLPEFTVCEECFSTVVYPAIKDGSDVANKIRLTPDLVHEEREATGRDSRGNRTTVTGTSCQLYSRRMRRTFKKAVELNDFEHLAERAKARKKAEMDLQAKNARLQQRLMQLDPLIASGDERRSYQAQMQREDLMDELNKITEDWRKWE